MVVSAVKRAPRAQQQCEANQPHLVTLVAKNSQKEQRAQKANEWHQKNLPFNSEPIEISDCDSQKGPLHNGDEAGPFVDPNKPTRLHDPVDVEATNLLDSVEEDTINILNQGEENVLGVLCLIDDNMANDEDKAEYEEEMSKDSLWPVFHKNAQSEALKDSSPQPDPKNQLNITTAQPPQISDEEEDSVLKSQSGTEANNKHQFWIQKIIDDYCAAASKNDRVLHSKQKSQMASIEK
ncbi:hypothetical protein DFH28DRAFT_929313 [Melampsora americana]|nr:hypothetical protein DFH28DRAFT_929313 [Melampsora americana]